LTAAGSRFAAMLLVSLVFTACARESGQPTPKPADPAITTPSPASDAAPSTAVTSTGSTATPKLDQAWATAILTDVATGRTFRIADFVAADKVVFVETMAI
jgi:hypothetical protein